MQKKPKESDESDEEKEGKEDSWKEDQKHRGYYYDDAYGYEAFDPEDEEAQNDKEE